MELGSCTSFWDVDFKLWSPLGTPTWIKHTCKDLGGTPLSIKGPMEMVPLLRPQDSLSWMTLLLLVLLVALLRIFAACSTAPLLLFGCARRAD